MIYAITAVIALAFVVVTIALVLTGAAFKRALQKLSVYGAALEKAEGVLSQVSVGYCFPDSLSRLISSAMVEVGAALDYDFLDDEEDDEEVEDNPEPFVHATPEVARAVSDALDLAMVRCPTCRTINRRNQRACVRCAEPMATSFAIVGDDVQ
jgi:hypothetical protein